MTKTRHQILTTFCILLFAFCVFCTFGAISVSAAEATVIASGDCSAEGSSVQWKYDDTTNTLTIFGKGAMADYHRFERISSDFLQNYHFVINYLFYLC
ncbi:MAG: hypothetical protein E7676_03405 [Ruminococcaceae bacterium]|nr:hypothetical protein [Oscillospiraceae bacterium]